MSANVETMFSVREKPWHGLGTIVTEALSAEEALGEAGLDWKVEGRKLYTEQGIEIPGYQANVRNTDQKVLGVVSERYEIVQNQEAFAFTDELLGEGVSYETAGSLQEGKRTWILAKLPQKYIISGDEITPYLVFMNSHDGSCSIKAAMTPVRVVCQNTLNLAVRTAKRSWSAKHTEKILTRMDEARNTLLFAESYMEQLGKTVDELNRIRLTDKKVLEYIQEFFPVTAEMSDIQKKNNERLQHELKMRYFDAPDLKEVGKNGYRFVNAIADFATHAKPLRVTKNYKENIFLKTAEGNPMTDKAYQMVLAA